MRQYEFRFRAWGGRREGAGRRPAPGRRRVTHRPRPPLAVHAPAHVTLRRAARLPSLRDGALFPAVRDALAGASTDAFRVLHWSVQADHVHLVVEADRGAFVRGCQGLAIRVAKAVNRTLRRRGAVWGDRYHARSLTTPRAVRNALVYVLANWKKHQPGARGVDPRSSGRWFDGWRISIPRPAGAAGVAVARTWLARVGWRRHGLVDVREVPRRAP